MTEKDPLFTIFEQHLYNCNESNLNRDEFVEKIVEDYLTFLTRKGIGVPPSLRSAIVAELKSDVRALLIKRTYGKLSVREFQNEASLIKKNRVKRRYQKLKIHSA